MLFKNSPSCLAGTKEHSRLRAGSLNQAVKAKIVKTDPATDMALLKLDKPINAEPVKFADARDNQIVYTIGFPKIHLGILSF